MLIEESRTPVTFKTDKGCKVVSREPDQDPICLEFVDSDIVYFWKAASRMDMDCKVIQLTEAF